MCFARVKHKASALQTTTAELAFRELRRRVGRSEMDRYGVATTSVA